jgi:hypothetical protein
MRHIYTLSIIFLLNAYFAIINTSNAEFASPTSFYANSKVIVEPDVFKLYWNYTKTFITAEIHVKTSTGWIGFGISPNGGMDGSDVIIFFMENGVANFTDRHIKKREVLVDKSQDWKLISHSIANGYTIVKFTRDLNTCDENEDMVIEEGTPRIIYAWNDNTPKNGVIVYHGTRNRGTSAVQLISALNQQQSTIRPEDKIINHEFTVNVNN